MPKKSQKSSVKKTSGSKKPVVRRTKKLSPKQKLLKPFETIKQRLLGLADRRPHRSFRLSDRRDYRKPPTFPGFWSFTGHVFKNLKNNKKAFICLVLVYAALLAIFGAITNQELYNQIADYVSNAGGQIAEGGVGAFGEAIVVVSSAFLSSPGTLSAEQQAYLSLGLLMVWLATVWLHREYLAGKMPKLRDALYRANAPFLSTLMVLLIMFAQLIPMLIIAAVYAGITSIGLLSEGFGMMIFSVTTALVAALVLYWMTSTFIALVIVTLPGMYPMQAIRSAGDMVVGVRLRILFRILWMLLILAIVWLVVMVPLVMLVSWLNGLWQPLSYVPLMPIFASVMTAASIVFAASYIYLMYRKLVDDGDSR